MWNFILFLIFKVANTPHTRKDRTEKIAAKFTLLVCLERIKGNINFHFLISTSLAQDVK